MNKTSELLESLGLSPAEARCYLALVELQESRTGPLCRKANIPSSHAYAALDSLIQRGLASWRIQNNVRVYQPASPKALSRMFEKKQAEIKHEAQLVTRLVENISRAKLERKPTSSYKYFEGLQGVISMWNEINESLANMESGALERVYGARIEGFKKLVGTYDAHHAARNKTKIPCRIIMPVNARELGRRRKNAITQVRYAPLANTAEWGVVGDSIYLQHVTSGTPRAFLIKDATFAATFALVFDSVWDALNNGNK